MTPLDNPTVPIAETASKIMFKKLMLSFSTMAMPKMQINVENRKRVMTENALIILSFSIRLLNAEASLLDITWRMATMMVKNVVVLIPPPVDPGEAPMNISKITMHVAGVLSNVMSTELNPAVLADTDRKNDSMNERLGSHVFKRIPPIAIRHNVTVRTILVWNASFFHLCFRLISPRTKKPIPPTMIRRLW